MSLTLYYHPLSSFCMKVLIALYENETPFTPHIVDLMDEKDRAGELVEYGETRELFVTPKDHRTEAYITGRFG